MARPVVILEVSGLAVGFRELPDGEALSWNGPAVLVDAGSPQLILAFESALTNTTEFEVDASGDLVITPSGTAVTVAGDFSANAASFTTGAFSGDLTVGASKFVVTATTGALEMDGSLVVLGSGPHSWGSASSNKAQLNIAGAYTASGSVAQRVMSLATDLTASSGATTLIAMFYVGSVAGGSITTQNNSETIADVATCILDEPGITKGSDTITNASTLLLTGAPTEGAANWALRSVSGAWYNGGTFQQVGNVGIGVIPSANADLVLEAGKLMLKETTTPTADANYGKVYTQSDNLLYFQDGAGIEHTVSISDYAGIEQDDNANATTIRAANIPTLIDNFDSDMPELISNGDFANNEVTVGASRDYDAAVHGSFSCAAVNKECELMGWEISSVTQNIEDATDADPCVLTITGHNLSGGENVFVADIVGMVELNDQIYKVVRLDDDTFSLDAQDGTDVDATGYTGYTSGGTIAICSEITQGCQECVSANKLYNAGDATLAALTKDYLMKAFVMNEESDDDVTVKYCHLKISGA